MNVRVCRPVEVGVDVHRAWALAVAAVTAGWVAATLGGGDPMFLTTNTRGTAAAAAAAALTGPSWFPRTRGSAIGAGAALVLLPLAVALASGGSTLLLGAVLVVAATVEATGAVRSRGAGRRRALASSFGLAVATTCLVAGVLVERGDDTTSLALPAADPTAALLGLVGATLLLVLAAVGPQRSRALVVPALLVGVVSVTAWPPLWTAVVGAVVAVAWAARLPERPAPVLAALAVAAAVSPAGGPAAALLAAGASLAVLVNHPAGALLGLPGAAALAAALVAAGPEAPLVVLVVGLSAASAVLGLRGGNAPRGTMTGILTGVLIRDGKAALEVAPAAVLALWLVLSPGSWRWTGGAGLGTYDRGAPAAAATAALVVVGRRVFTVRPRGSSMKIADRRRRPRTTRPEPGSGRRIRPGRRAARPAP